LPARNECAPGQASYHDTVGVALYRNNQFTEAASVLEKSLKDSAATGTSVNLLVLAMCHHRLGDTARNCFDRGERSFEERHGKISPLLVEQLAEFKAQARSFLQTR